MATIKFPFACPKCGQGFLYTRESLKVGECRNKNCRHRFNEQQLATITKGLDDAEKERKIRQVSARVIFKNR